ncbi:MAG: valine--tRNA ligase [bacterium]|nr:valine--tRNA ligase [bacterium]
MTLPKAYEWKEHEDKIYQSWEDSGMFNPDNLPDGEPYTIALPPPNVTGTLHLGHAVMLAIEDVMIRYQRMQGKKALWIPGTDHAGIATQTKVEKILIKEGIADPRHELGREAFLKRVEEFAAESHDTIVNQAKKMGASLDWSREAYTFDEARSKAVKTVFKMMYEDDLIYKGDRVVNWCPRCKSTLSDDEVEYREEKSKFYYFKYGPVIIGTARPETKFLDKTIIVHPADERYQDMIGKEFDVEWIDGKVAANMIADEAADKDFGSGAMTITPGHSMVDFELAKKHDLPIVKIIDEDGNFTKAAGEFAGKNARESRDEIVARLQEKGLVDRIDEDYVHNLSICYRCDSAIEPLPKIQWFIDVNKKFKHHVSGKEVSLKQLMQEAVKSDDIQIIPDRFNKIYFHWIDNLRDWNISRQIWYGHRVPVWYKGDEIYVGVEEPAGEGWEQDPDTLDTWFSSGLWTFSTLGWPDKTEDYKMFHPTNVLETGYDILFFWVARMILMTTYAVGDVPFKNVYLHGLVRDKDGRKMSKSLDNAIDPLDMIEKYGTDALRLALMVGTTPGNDSRLYEEKIAGYRNFVNKIWNVSRYVLLQEVGDQIKEESLADKWIKSRLADVINKVTADIENYRFSAAAELAYDFLWHEFADWYVEITKFQPNPLLAQEVLETTLKLLHPFVPFVTEVLWQELGKEQMLLISEWPQASEIDRDKKMEKEFALLQDIVIQIRNLRGQYKISYAKQISVYSANNISPQVREIIEKLCKVDFGDKIKDSASTEITNAKYSLTINLGDVIDVVAEQKRLQKEIDKLNGYVIGLEKKLGNESYTGNAPADVVERDKKNLAEKKETLTILRESFEALS